MPRGTQVPTSSPPDFAYVAITLCGRPFQDGSAISRIGNSTWRGPYDPRSSRRTGQPGLGCSDFARRYFRNRGCFLFLRVLRWFTSPGGPRHPMYSDDGDPALTGTGFPIRTSPGHWLLAPLRSLSQLATSFIACLRQGIHRTPLVA